MFHSAIYSLKKVIMKRTYLHRLVLALLVCNTSALLAQQDQLQFSTDFPGGNILVEKVSHDTVFLKPDLRDTEGDWFYWYFGVRAAAGRTLTFQFADVRKLAAFGPAISKGRGKSWRWLYQEPAVRTSFTYPFPTDDEEVRFSLGIPYLQENLDAFLAKHSRNTSLRADTLCLSAKGRVVEQLFIGDRGSVPKYKVVITARHHACEMMSSYELEGIMEALLSKDKNMKWLRRQVEFMILPFVDKDGVEEGDQGKNRNGQDHNRDYSGESRYVETASIRKALPVWAEDKLRMVFDLHCPYVNATTVPRNETVFIVESGIQEIAREQRKWMAILEKNRKGELTFDVDNSLMPYGIEWNSDSGSSQGQRYTFTRWVRSHIKNVAMSTTVEFPYAINDGQMITPDNARAFGKDIAHSIAIYLQQLER